MLFAILILLAVVAVLIGAISPKPIGWVAVGFGVLCILLLVLGGLNGRIAISW